VLPAGNLLDPWSLDNSFDDFRNEDKIVRCAWGKAKHGFPRKAGLGKVVSRHIKNGISVCSWLHPGDIEFLEMLDMLEDAVQLTLESAYFLLPQGNAGESGDVADIKIAAGHAKKRG
jgi:hypothetical protein